MFHDLQDQVCCYYYYYSICIYHWFKLGVFFRNWKISLEVVWFKLIIFQMLNICRLVLTWQNRQFYSRSKNYFDVASHTTICLVAQTPQEDYGSFVFDLLIIIGHNLCAVFVIYILARWTDYLIALSLFIAAITTIS